MGSLYNPNQTVQPGGLQDMLPSMNPMRSGVTSNVRLPDSQIDWTRVNANSRTAQGQPVDAQTAMNRSRVYNIPRSNSMSNPFADLFRRGGV